LIRAAIASALILNSGRLAVTSRNASSMLIGWISGVYLSKIAKTCSDSSR
jgi:hypothetical protein